MSWTPRTFRAVVRDVRRLVSPLDVMYHVGNMVYRRSLRYTVFVVGISILGVLARQFSLPGLTIKQAIALPLIIGGLALVFGSVLRVIPGLISSRLLTVAQATDLNLMEDYRKTQTDQHLEAIWQRVFRYEFLLDSPEADRDAEEKARTDFLARAHEALSAHLPQIRQMHLIGLDLRYLEDWRDGAYLDRSDTKLREQFEGNSTLTAVRREVGLWGMRGMLTFKSRQFARTFWFRFITRMISMEVGACVERLNKLYDTDLFNSQVLLWPGEENAPWLEKFDGARDEVLRRRTKAIRNVFGPDFETATEVLDRMLYDDFALAGELRMRYDMQYCTGKLDYDAMADLHTGCREPRNLKRAGRMTRRARKGLPALKRFLSVHRGELLEPSGAAAMRAVSIAFHINKDNLKLKLLRHIVRGESTQPASEIATMIDRAAAGEQACTRRLIGVRIHHELTRLARSGYHDLVKALGYA